jgi:hypothetical protein
MTPVPSSTGCDKSGISSTCAADTAALETRAAGEKLQVKLLEAD